ncbi:MAG TPA: hypothetical protein VN850_10315 [Candidatus Acidoferrales bacterium]|nr:hypothetical protein [Candidatus Acidoferrales bacterium]
MKLVLGTAVMMLLLGAPSYARQEPDKDKPQEEPKRQEEPKKGEQPNKGKQDQEKPAAKSKQEPDKQQQDRERAKPAQQDSRQQNDRAQQNDRNRNDQSKPAQQQDRAQEQQRAQQTEQHSDRGNATERGSGRRVPDEQFRASFGREHHFHVRRSDDRRFNYGGYYFQYSEPWPSDWDYNNDDVYIDYIDGNYYLINPRHSGVRLLVVVVD